LEEQVYAMSLLLLFYAKFVHWKKVIGEEKWKAPQADMEGRLKEETAKKANIHLDTIGDLFLGQLVIFNKAGKFANEMTNRLLAIELP
jgi:hypothetical protein